MSENSGFAEQTTPTIGGALLRLDTPSAVIDALGGTQAVAKLLTVGASSVSNYRKQGFPARHCFRLARLAHENGLVVADSLFGGASHPPPMPRPAPIAPASDAPLAPLIAAGYEPLSLAILQPAAPFINRMGLELQRRLYKFTDPGGEELCLRPDLTIPTALTYISSRRRDKARYCYHGTAFRYQRRGAGRPQEFTQIGVEIIGGGGEANDMRAVLNALLSIVRRGGLSPAELTIMFDGAKDYRALLADFDLPSHAVTRLIHAIRRAKGDPKRFAELALGGIGTARSAEAGRVPEAMIAGRSNAEIAARLAALDMSGAQMERYQAAVDAIAAPSKAADKAIAANIKEEIIAQLAPNYGGLRWGYGARAAAGMDYYSGLSFTLYADGDARAPIARGGVYNSLLRSLGAAQDIAALGGAVDLDALAGVRR